MKALMIAVSMLAASSLQSYAGQVGGLVSEGIVITVGNIYPGSADVDVFNYTEAPLASVFLHCTFRDAAGGRIDDVPILVTNLGVRDTAKERARTTNRTVATSVECRVD